MPPPEHWAARGVSLHRGHWAKNIYEARNNAASFLFEYKRPIFWGDMGGFL